MLLSVGTQDRILAEATTGAGVSSREGSTLSDSLLVSLWATSVTSGTLSVTVYTLTDTGREEAVITFPAVSTGTTSLLLRKAAVTLQRFRVTATYTGVCTYEVYVRAISGGESSARILGAATWQVTQADVTTTPALLIPASLDDRAGLLIKNWSDSRNVFVAESLAKIASGDSYPLAPRDGLSMDLAAGAQVYAVAEGGTADVRIVESGG